MTLNIGPNQPKPGSDASAQKPVNWLQRAIAGILHPAKGEGLGQVVKIRDRLEDKRASAIDIRPIIGFQAVAQEITRLIALPQNGVRQEEAFQASLKCFLQFGIIKANPAGANLKGDPRPAVPQVEPVQEAAFKHFDFYVVIASAGLKGMREFTKLEKAALGDRSFTDEQGPFMIDRACNTIGLQMPYPRADKESPGRTVLLALFRSGATAEPNKLAQLVNPDQQAAYMKFIAECKKIQMAHQKPLPLK